MQVAHMQAHPTVAGVVWDANGKFRDDVGAFVPRYVPDPRHVDIFTSPDAIELFNAQNPAIAFAQANWGQTDEDQWATSNRWQVEAAAAGIEF